MGRICRWLVLVVMLLPVTPATAQAHSPSAHSPQATRAACLGKHATRQASPGQHLVVGTPGADVIVGTKAADEIRGRGGNDLICGGGGSDLLAGGPGRDRLRGGPGADFLVGGAGRDECAGNAGANTYSSCEVMQGVSPGAGQPPPLGQPPAPVDKARPQEVDSQPEVVDRPPAAVADAAAVGENSGATSIDVLANDTDSDGGPKTLVSATEPQHGEVSIADDGSTLTYEPAADYCNDGEAADEFAYTLNGGSTATVSVAVECVTQVSIGPEALIPAFDPSVSDYTVRCDGSPLEMSGRTAQDASISVDGKPAASGKFEASVPLEEGQEFSFSVADSSGTNSYFVRCLPPDFPAWEYEQFRSSRSNLYVVAPTLGPNVTQYAVIFDRNGVPVWWDTESPGRIINPSVLNDGTVAWWRDEHGFIVHNLSGAILGEINAVTGPTDLHELQQTPNGNYLLISSKIREHLDLTDYGFGPDEEVHDYIVEEVNPQGQLVWSWDTGNHIGLAETGRWWQRLGDETPRDIVHMNAIEADGEDAVLVSLRHTDAIYKVDKNTGEILWKLGGTWTPKSLNVIDDPEGAYPLGGQHDVRLMPDGTITIYDNNTDQPSPPRAVRYEINEAQKTATLLEEVSDPLVSTSFCCGSARRAADGSWLMSWGGDSLVSEFDPAGQRTFSLGFGGTVFSYRAVPVEDGLLDVSSLRAGMDTMHPRS